MPTKTQANDLVRQAIRMAVFSPSLKDETYRAMTIADLRRELEEALAPEVPEEKNRLIHLNVSINRRFRKAGFLIQVPKSSWYLDATRQHSTLPVIADFILSQSMQPA